MPVEDGGMEALPVKCLSWEGEGEARSWRGWEGGLVHRCFASS